jgi:uncharacterized protein
MLPLRPVAASTRLGLLDALRGFALCGILFVNIIDMGGPIAMSRPLAAPSLANPDWQIWTFSQLFLTGTMRGLFSILFGVGLLLFLGGEREEERLPAMLRRLSLLLLFGIVDATLLLWPGDILVTYALAGAIALCFRRLPPARLLGLAGIVMLLLSTWGALEAPGIRPADMVYSAPMLAREGAARLGSYGDSLAYMTLVSWIWAKSGFLYVWIGDALMFVLLGMALHKLDWFRREGRPTPLWRILAICYGGGLSLRLLQLLLTWPDGSAPTTLSAFVDQPARLLMTFGHLSLFLSIWRLGKMPWTTAVFERMGRMPLTLYLGQSLAGACIFAGFGLGYWNGLTWPELWLVAVAILIVEAAFAWLWFRAFAYGPLEWLWRWGTYGRRPALMR